MLDHEVFEVGVSVARKPGSLTSGKANWFLEGFTNQEVAPAPPALGPVDEKGGTV